VDKQTQDIIIMDVVERILRSNNKLLYLEHIQPNRKRLSWKWEEFDFDGRIVMASVGTGNGDKNFGNGNEVITA
jgi:hypothetical protein